MHTITLRGLCLWCKLYDMTKLTFFVLRCTVLEIFSRSPCRQCLKDTICKWECFEIHSKIGELLTLLSSLPHPCFEQIREHSKWSQCSTTACWPDIIVWIGLSLTYCSREDTISALAFLIQASNGRLRRWPLAVLQDAQAVLILNVSCLVSHIENALLKNASNLSQVFLCHDLNLVMTLNSAC